MSLFDEILPKTARIVEAATFASNLASVTVIRDLKGRVRLVLEFQPDANGRDLLPADWQTALPALEQQLANELRMYWGGQIWRTRQRDDPAYRALADTIINQRQAWRPDPSVSSVAFNWYKLERTFSKSAWIGPSFRSPWTLADLAKPAVVSFYSFKGGVGRTTAMAAVALLLARASRRVVVFDLDLEAPGIGSFLLGSHPSPNDGIVDYLLEQQLSGQRPINLDLLYVATQNDVRLIGGGEPIRVLTAGQLNGDYLEKLARLDFEGFVNQAVNPLADLLDHVQQEYTPDFILLDVRAGLHDLGGLSLNGLSHLDVLFGLDTPQSWAGLEIVLSVLGAAESRPEVLLAHAMATPLRFDAQANERFRSASYGLFQSHYYDVSETMPDVDDREAPYGLPIPYQEELLNVSDLTQVVDVLTEVDGPYARLVKLVGTYVQRGTI